MTTQLKDVTVTISLPNGCALFTPDEASRVRAALEDARGALCRYCRTSKPLSKAGHHIITRAGKTSYCRARLVRVALDLFPKVPHDHNHTHNERDAISHVVNDPALPGVAGRPHTHEHGSYAPANDPRAHHHDPAQHLSPGPPVRPGGGRV